MGKIGLLVFTKDDKENIKKSLTFITDDIRSMRESSQVESIRIDGIWKTNTS